MLKSRYFPVLLIIITTFFTSSAQVFFKLGVKRDSILNPFIISGAACYLVAAVLAIVSFRKGQVSIIYPIFATSYIWVSILSVYFFSESISPLRWMGVFTIFAGVLLIGFTREVPHGN